eukprot:Skav221313  [mRNA]  locus=scaffold2901:105094:118807:- [translate_table: standard]
MKLPQMMLEDLAKKLPPEKRPSGASKDRAPAAMPSEEGGVPNHERAFEEGFVETRKNTHFERILSVHSPLGRGHVLPFSSPAWRGHVPLTERNGWGAGSGTGHDDSAHRQLPHRCPAEIYGAPGMVRDWIDSWGGWWLYRWGDAAIRAVQLWVMLEERSADPPRIFRWRCGDEEPPEPPAERRAESVAAAWRATEDAMGQAAPTSSS